MRLGDICSKIGSGATPRGGKEAYSTSGIPIIRSQNVLDWSFSSNGLAYLNDEQARTLSNVEVHQGDILLNITGDSVARACIVPDDVIPARVNQHVAILRPKEKANATFILAWLQTNKDLLLKLASSGATRNALTKRMLEGLDINLPSIDIQNHIAALISLIQSKINLNIKLNGYLEKLVSLEFSRRFKASTPTIELGKVLSISTESIKPQEHAGEIWEHYSIPAYDENRQPLFELSDGIKSNKYAIDANCILISKLNPATKRIWMPSCTSEHSVCSTEFIVYKPKNPRYKSFYYAAIDSQAFTDFLIAHVTGSTGSRQRTQPKATLTYPMPNPGHDAIEGFCAFANPIYKQIQSNKLESKWLVSLRDALLPKLMSGEIDVSKIDLTQLNSHLVQRDSVRSKPVDDVFLDQSFSLRAGANICSFTCR